MYLPLTGTSRQLGPRSFRTFLIIAMYPHAMPGITLQKGSSTSRMQLLLLPAPARVAQFPEDLLRVILGHLESVRDVAAARGVCRTWRDVIDNTTPLWRNLTFNLPRRMPEHAETWYRKAAQCGNVQAQVSALINQTSGIL